jgi:ribosome-binding protein aMBF1 (putative translation factor)
MAKFSRPRTWASRAHHRQQQPAGPSRPWLRNPTRTGHDIIAGLRARPVGSRRARPYKRTMPDAEETTKDPLLAAVGERIKNLREFKGIAPKEFAEAAGFSLSYLWRLESGQQNINLRSISRLALALGEPMSALLDGIDPDPETLGARAYVHKTSKPRSRKATSAGAEA